MLIHQDQPHHQPHHRAPGGPHPRSRIDRAVDALDPDALTAADVLVARRANPPAQPAPAAAVVVRPANTSPEPWKHRAACHGQPLALFYDRARQPEAQAVCARCPVQPQCFADTIMGASSREEACEGVRGGTTGAQRYGLLFGGIGRRARSCRHLGWDLEATAAWLQVPVEQVAQAWAASDTVRARRPRAAA